MLGKLLGIIKTSFSLLFHLKKKKSCFLYMLANSLGKISLLPAREHIFHLLKIKITAVILITNSFLTGLVSAFDVTGDPRRTGPRRFSTKNSRKS